MGKISVGESSTAKAMSIHSSKTSPDTVESETAIPRRKIKGLSLYLSKHFTPTRLILIGTILIVANMFTFLALFPVI